MFPKFDLFISRVHRVSSLERTFGKGAGNLVRRVDQPSVNHFQSDFLPPVEPVSSSFTPNIHLDASALRYGYATSLLLSAIHTECVRVAITAGHRESHTLPCGN